MRRIFLSFLVIVLINPQQTESQALAFIKQAFYHIENLYNQFIAFEEFYRNMKNGGDVYHAISEKLDTVIHEVQKIVRQVADMEHKINEKIETKFDKLYVYIDTTSELHNEKSEINTNVNRVNYLFDEAVKFKDSESYQNDSLKHFIDLVFYSEKDLRATLINIFQLINPKGSLKREGYLSRMYNQALEAYKVRCRDSFSPQQNLYYTYITVITTEIKAFATITFAYILQYKLNRKNFTTECMNDKANYVTRLEEYGKIFMSFMPEFPADVRRCDIQLPKYGENYIFLEKFLSSEIFDERHLWLHRDKEMHCWGTCEDFRILYNTSTGVVSGCESLGSKYKICGTKPPSHRRYEWIHGNKNFGHDTNNNECFESRGYGHHEGVSYCDNCLCTTENHDIDYVTRRISFTPQISDISQNMIVVGVRFALRDKAIHLQIKHAKMTENGIDPSTSVWKPLDVDANQQNVTFEYGLVGNWWGVPYYMNLDDVIIPPNHVVTGIRFVERPMSHVGPKIDQDNGFQLEVFSVEYDYTTNKISSSSTRWNKPGDFPINSTNYQRARAEINLKNSDDPLRATDYDPDSGTNKKVAFQVTSRIKDVGQSAVPYFDAQPVEVKPEFPLRGIGLFHRSRSGFGGYIAPRLITYNMTEIIELFTTEQKNIREVKPLINFNENQTRESPTANNGKKNDVTDSKQNQRKKSPRKQKKKIEVDINSNEYQSSNLPIKQDSQIKVDIDSKKNKGNHLPVKQNPKTKAFTPPEYRIIDRTSLCAQEVV